MAKIKEKMKEGSAEEEATETKGEEAAEQKSGEKEGVKVPEEFQKAAYALVDDANEHELAYLQECMSKRRQEIYEEEKDGEMSTEGMPD